MTALPPFTPKALEKGIADALVEGKPGIWVHPDTEPALLKELGARKLLDEEEPRWTRYGVPLIVSQAIPPGRVVIINPAPPYVQSFELPKEPTHENENDSTGRPAAADPGSLLPGRAGDEAKADADPGGTVRTQPDAEA